MKRPMLKSQFAGQFRCGRVSSVDKDKHTVQVQFEEQDGFVSPDFNMLVPFGGDYVLPAKDTAVLCLLIEGRLSDGFILGSFYNEADAPSLDDEKKRAIAGADILYGNEDTKQHVRGEVYLGGGDDPSDKVALAPKVKEELDKIKTELDNIKTGLSTHTHPYTDTPAGPATTSPPADPPYTVGYSPTEPSAEKVYGK